MKFIRSAVEEIIGTYKGSTPLVHFLKPFFKARPKLGSRDRRAISEAVYTFYRMARSVPQAEQHIWGIIDLALQNELIIDPQLQQICTALQPAPISTVLDNDPFGYELSTGISVGEWYDSMLLLPNTFIRLRVAAFNILPILKAKDLDYEQIGEQTIAFPNGYNLSELLPEQFYVVQDHASQQSLDAFMGLSGFKPEDKFTVWDTCSGAGGKMLMLKDKFPKAQILCTDVRASILYNLRARAKTYYHKNVVTRVLDSSDSKAVKKIDNDFDCVLSDVPCTGSGTWARTPEQFYFFDPKQIREFQALQSSIAINAVTKVRPGGYFIYITCSVFRSENEDVVENVLKAHPQLTLLHQSLINGIEDGADCMFVAVMRRTEI